MKSHAPEWWRHHVSQLQQQQQHTRVVIYRPTRGDSVNSLSNRQLIYTCLGAPRQAHRKIDTLIEVFENESRNIIAFIRKFSIFTIVHNFGFLLAQ